jgi:hypothetical protein
MAQRRLHGKVVIATHNSGKLVEMRDLLAPFGCLALQPHGGAQPGLEGLALQGAAAEAVDGGDVGPLQLLKGQEQSPAQGRGRDGALGRQPVRQRLVRLPGRFRGGGGIAFDTVRAGRHPRHSVHRG